MTDRPSYRETYGYLPEPCVRLLESGPDGEELMMRVIARLGGQRVKVPARLSSQTVIVRELGVSDAERLWKVWRAGAGGEAVIVVPRMSAAANKARRARLLSLLASEVTVREAARRFGLTERAIYKMLARARELGETADLAAPQLDLFPAC